LRKLLAVWAGGATVMARRLAEGGRNVQIPGGAVRIAAFPPGRNAVCRTLV